MMKGETINAEEWKLKQAKKKAIKQVRKKKKPNEFLDNLISEDEEQGEDKHHVHQADEDDHHHARVHCHVRTLPL